MSYILLGNNNKANIGETIAKNRGVEDLSKIVNPTKEDCHSFELMGNMEEGVNLVADTISFAKNNGGANVLVKVDSDVDGKTSSSIIINYLDRLAEHLDIDLNVDFLIEYDETRKIHGISAENIPDDTHLLIIPDAGTNSTKDLKEIMGKGVSILVLDHHNKNEGETPEDYAVVINNQLCDYPNKTLSGAGVVYKFCQGLDDYFDVEFADYYLDLVALGLIGDSMDMTNAETRYLTKKGLANINNDFIKALKEKQAYSLKNQWNFNSISFYIAPLINAMVRYGSEEERNQSFSAFLDRNKNKTIDWNKRGVEEPIKQPLAEGMARICGNVKARQDNARNKAVETLVAQVEEENLAENNLLLVNATGVLDGRLTGLVAMQLASRYKRPTLILREFDYGNKTVFSGSGRNFNHSPIESFGDILKDSGYFNFIGGHDNAFGYELNANRLDELIDYGNETLKDMGEAQHYVDFVFDQFEVEPVYFDEIHSFANEWSKGFDEPYIVIENLNLEKANIELIGRYENTMKIQHNGIEYMKFSTNREEFEEFEKMARSGKLTNFIGRVGMNHWRGTVTPQLIISATKFTEKTMDSIIGEF